jgi:hypothetical protein
MVVPERKAEMEEIGKGCVFRCLAQRVLIRWSPERRKSVDNLPQRHNQPKMPRCIHGMPTSQASRNQKTQTAFSIR